MLYLRYIAVSLLLLCLTAVYSQDQVIPAWGDGIEYTEGEYKVRAKRYVLKKPEQTVIVLEKSHTDSPDSLVEVDYFNIAHEGDGQLKSLHVNAKIVEGNIHYQTHSSEAVEADYKQVRSVKSAQGFFQRADLSVSNTNFDVQQAVVQMQAEKRLNELLGDPDKFKRDLAQDSLRMLVNFGFRFDGF